MSYLSLRSFVGNKIAAKFSQNIGRELGSGAWATVYEDANCASRVWKFDKDWSSGRAAAAIAVLQRKGKLKGIVKIFKAGVIENISEYITEREAETVFLDISGGEYPFRNLYIVNEERLRPIPEGSAFGETLDALVAESRLIRWAPVVADWIFSHATDPRYWSKIPSAKTRKKIIAHLIELAQIVNFEAKNHPVAISRPLTEVAKTLQEMAALKFVVTDLATKNWGWRNKREPVLLDLGSSFPPGGG